MKIDKLIGSTLPPGISLESKMVTKKMHLPYTVVSEKIVDENELELKDEIVQVIAKQMAMTSDAKIMEALGATTESIEAGEPVNMTTDKMQHAQDLIGAQEKKKGTGFSKHNLLTNLYDNAKKMILGVDPAKGIDETAVWSNVVATMKLDNQTKTIFNKAPFVLKDPELVHAYTLPINYDLWDEYPELKQKYAVGTHHKMDDIVFEVIEHEKDILHQKIKIQMKEAVNIGMTGPNDSLMDGIPKDPSLMLDQGDTVVLDKLTITPPKGTDEEADAFVLKKRSERSKLFYELTHGVSLSE